ncbi:MAG TPA: 2,3-diaminopropionate biosynthesis protein SbnA [Pyrinomonadaceae bacterium]
MSAIGNTPLVKLSRLCKDYGFQVFAKLEALNPGGSMKDRPAYNIIRHALETGAVDSDTVVIESSSGNMGIGLAQACAYYELRFVCVVDVKTTQQNLRVLKAYGAEVHVVSEPDPETGEFLPARINHVKALAEATPKSFWVNQYANEQNALAHHQTMREIVNALDGRVDYLFCATSTCGTLRGCREYVTAHHVESKIYGVDAVGSVVFGGERSKRLLPGHGSAFRPELFRSGLVDEFIHVTDTECVVGCRRLARHEAILAGGSSGGIFMALERVRHQLEPGANCALIFPDRGDRYLDTIYSDAWVSSHFGDISHLWTGRGGAEPRRPAASTA